MQTQWTEWKTSQIPAMLAGASVESLIILSDANFSKVFKAEFTENDILEFLVPMTSSIVRQEGISFYFKVGNVLLTYDRNTNQFILENSDQDFLRIQGDAAVLFWEWLNHFSRYIV